MRETGVLFVCLGNICRSPSAEGIFREKLRRAGLGSCVRVDSAGTGGWHVGEAPDPRAQAAARQRGYDISALRARQVCAQDFLRFDYILAMDSHNLNDLRRVGAFDQTVRVERFLDVLPDSPLRDVPDPYYGGTDGFFQMIDLLEAAADAWVLRLQALSSGENAGGGKAAG